MSLEENESGKAKTGAACRTTVLEGRREAWKSVLVDRAMVDRQLGQADRRTGGGNRPRFCTHSWLSVLRVTSVLPGMGL